MLITDKKHARKFYSQIRKSISERERLIADEMIYHNFINSQYFNDFDTILCYVSFKDEADTRRIIEYSLDNGKRIYVPECVGKEMSFYELKSIDELIEGRFGIPTVNTDGLNSLSDFKNALCIVPALSFDRYGNRIGYGGGYYDRFLKSNKIFTLGLTFDSCFCDILPSEEFDIAVDAVLTESGIKILENSEKREVSTYE